MDTEPMYGFGAGAGGVGLIVLFLHMLVWGMSAFRLSWIPNQCLDYC